MNVLTAASAIGCGHPPGAVDTEGAATLTVAGQGVLTKGGVLDHQVEGCPTPDSSTTRKCRKVATFTAGEAGRLTVEGESALLEPLLGGTTSDGAVTVTGALTATANQSTLTAT